MTAKRLSIQNYQHDNKNLQTISHNPVNAVCEDNSGNLWVGTIEGGLNKKAVEATASSIIHTKAALLPTTLLAPSPPTGKEDCGLVHGAAASTLSTTKPTA